MKNIRVNIVLTVAALAVLAGAVSLAARSSRGQTQSPKTDTRVKPTVLITERGPAAKANASAAFAAAAAQNAVLENELSWKFGGKEQHGWYLYHSLIGRILNTQSAAPTDFAAALAVWQKNKGLSPSGVLDEDSLRAFVSGWQSN